jgi:hypothetical protein
MPAEADRARDTKEWMEIAAKDLRRMEKFLAEAPPDLEGETTEARSSRGCRKTRGLNHRNNFCR